MNEDARHRNGERQAGRGDAETRGRVETETPNASTHSTSTHSTSTRPTPTHSTVAASQRPRVSASRLRLFCAVELPAEARARAVEHIARLRERMPQARASWERAEKLHLTLKFFGDVAPERAHALSEALARAAQRVECFPLSIAGAGAFPPGGAPRVLWLGVRDETGSFARLHQAVEQECAAEQFKREERSFHPHLTIARLRSPTGARALAEMHRELGFEALELTVNEIVLMQSELGPRGSCYTVLSHHGLAR